MNLKNVTGEKARGVKSTRRGRKSQAPSSQYQETIDPLQKGVVRLHTAILEYNKKWLIRFIHGVHQVAS